MIFELFRLKNNIVMKILICGHKKYTSTKTDMQQITKISFKKKI